uniref:Riboflavin biosynthesis protein RibD n=1 Tax=Loigolactobacillus rennini TaxID=238013 RepID=A0A1K2I7U7_9LACO|nr:Diaminohydroxyphosphoribosylaminopyrimidine deaminase / 5-amino-6-(5-phosphoribosylamino)uracil reductase [Loigolactobacillus rennini]
MQADKMYMKKAVALAKKGRWHTYQNPLVGAVIVKNGQIIATGYHAKYGAWHAEKMALATCSHPEELKGSTLYVTLEPCAHYGKQPPCVQAVIDSGISRVVIGQVDPNPLVTGKGIQRLKDHHIMVKVGVGQELVAALNPHYNYFYQHGLPYITLKQALSLDGKLTSYQGRRTQITGRAANQLVHAERQAYQAILVGSGTIIADNPQLLPKPQEDHVPIRIILDRRGRTLHFDQYHVFAITEPIWIFTKPELAHLPTPPHVKLIGLTKPTVKAVVAYLAQQKIQSVYVEGGATIHRAFLAAGIYQEIVTYLAPKILGTGLSAFAGKEAIDTTELQFDRIERVGTDLKIVSKRRP